RRLRRASDTGHRRLVRCGPLLPLDAAGLRIDRLAGGADPARAPSDGGARLEPARGLPGALAAEAAAPERAVVLNRQLSEVSRPWQRSPFMSCRGRGRRGSPAG